MIFVTLEHEDYPHSPSTPILIEPCLQDPVRLVSLSVGSFFKPNPPLACLAPPPAPDGSVLLSAKEIFREATFLLGSKVTYGCEDPCSTNVKDTFNCTVWGWSGEFSSYPLHCNNAPSVAHAGRSPISKREDSQARYLCDPGYYTSNLTLIQCIQREWISLRETSEYLVSQFKLILPASIESADGCGNTPLLINGAHKGENKFYQKHAFDDKIIYSCIDGFYLNAPSGAESTCLAGNRWSLNESASNFPICEPGSVAHYICYEGFSTIDIKTSTCRRNGTVVSWDLIQLPRCRIPENVCLSLPTTLNQAGTLLVDETLRNKDGISFFNGVEHGFGCQPGYRLVRDATLTCVEGNWNWTVNGRPAKAPLCYRGCGNPPLLKNG
ncbi:unnamed protein product [Clavelina lepadiformis]|uniref:Sushi domain-containing protein n=1 Tax=Clavelina lepadiformis TaxID=159417 RepID=A0ABP0G7S2_CLALP